ncbi:ash family protein [Buttiauxella sp. S19-1]
MCLENHSHSYECQCLRTPVGYTVQKLYSQLSMVAQAGQPSDWPVSL